MSHRKLVYNISVFLKPKGILLRIKYFFLSIILLCLHGFAYAATTKEVLLIHSYHQGYKWSDDMSDVIEQKFQEDENILLTIAYMDTKRIATNSYFEKLFVLYEEQFKNRTFDLVMLADNNALEFYLHYGKTLFDTTPFIFLGINNFDEKLLREYNMRFYGTGVVEQVDVEKNIELIMQLQPSTKKILIINDRSNTGLAMKKDIFKVLPKYSKKMEFEYVDDISIDNLANKVKTLPDNTVILWVLLFKDSTGKYFTHKESLKQIRKIARVPIYGLWDFYLGEGIVGGVLTSAKAQASAAAKMADMILKGTMPINLPILMESPNKYLFDYKELKRFDIAIPKSLIKYEMINEPFSFYKEYKEFVWSASVSFVMLMIVLVILLINTSKRISSEQALKNQLQFIRVLLDSIPNPINYKNLKGEYIGCNRAFANLLGCKPKEIIGKTVYDFFAFDWAELQTKKERELIKTEGTDHFEQTLHLQDGSQKVMTYSKTVYKNSDGKLGGVVSVMDDITQRNQQKQFLIQQAKLAEMGEMISAIAHQWNEPLVELSAILQDLEFSYKNNDLSEEQMQEFVKDSMIQIQYMSQTIKDFRSFLKPSVKKVLFSAQKAIDEVIEIIGKHIFYSYIDLHVEQNDANIMVYGYNNEFKQVLLNIINNAKLKIINSKKKGNIFISVEKKNDKTRFKIMDDAGPIDDSIKKFIFDPYFTTNKNGTGLGLYIAKVIIEDKMGGRIYARNFANNVIFYLDVPNKPEENYQGESHEDIVVRRQ
ncbi:MAG: PAS domain S-box protein [Sulfurospirillum sp.]|nr:PAS domain S-box protein [Sulfurospirillum sp.]